MHALQPGLLAFLAVTALATAVLTASSLPLLMPLLRRYALARPNARSSHRVPTPQGGGIAVVGAVVVAIAAALAFGSAMGPGEARSLSVLMASAVGLALLGAVDDIRPLPAALRFVVQAFAVAAVLWALPEGVRVFPEAFPLWAERILVLVAALWFVNLTNFMDGIDWMTVAGFVPLLAALCLLAALGACAPAGGLVAAALLGALAGFAPLNRPVARVFLGDVGSLPVGLLAGYAILRLAAEGHFAAACILPLYYLGDATVTLLRRLARRERVWEAHRTHFYQRATDLGLTVPQVIGRVFAANAVLAVLATVAAVRATTAPVLLATAAAIAALVVLLAELSRPRRRTAGDTAAAEKPR
jgi:UDP-N-acetylmuramyl pentapeptide phosphotransferase/UDP-N-acetylglucosamine-1-phosphate transferase